MARIHTGTRCFLPRVIRADLLQIRECEEALWQVSALFKDSISHAALHARDHNGILTSIPVRTGDTLEEEWVPGEDV